MGFPIITAITYNEDTNAYLASVQVKYVTKTVKNKELSINCQSCPDWLT